MRVRVFIKYLAVPLAPRHLRATARTLFCCVCVGRPYTTTMFIGDTKNDFYNVLIGKRVLIIVNYDLDAICASKILQCLFQYDHVQYTVVPIMGMSGLQRAYAENRDDVKFVVLINCGVCVDVVEVLQPDESVVFYVCDSHRPMDVCNIYSDSQVNGWMSRMRDWCRTYTLFGGEGQERLNERLLTFKALKTLVEVMMFILGVVRAV